MKLPYSRLKLRIPATHGKDEHKTRSHLHYADLRRSPNSMLSKPVPRVKVSFMDKPKQYRYQCSNRITDICSKGAQASFSKQILLLDLVQDNFYEPASFAVPQAQLEKRLTCPETVTLDEYLAACINDEDKRMTPKHQTLLALTIAASILQLQCTAWLPRAWTRTAIHFFTASDSIHGVLLEQPVIAHTISHTNNNPTSTANSSFILDPQVVFCELAILLLEIWHHISLETWKMRKDQTLTDSIEGRRCAAERWMRMSSNRLPLYYAKAIEECLVFCTRRTRSWDQDDFQSDICENVIKPLQECCRALVYV